MGAVSIKTQEKIMFIPWLNVMNIFFWFWNSISIYRTVRTLPRTIWIMFSSSLPLIILQLVVSRFHNTAGLVISYANIYFIPLLLSYRFIKYQKLIDNRT